MTHAVEREQALAARGVPALAIDAEPEIGARLPVDHPAWARDLVTLSQRARTLLERLSPVTLAVTGAWQHRVRALLVGGRHVAVDATGSYRVE